MPFATDLSELEQKVRNKPSIKEGNYEKNYSQKRLDTEFSYVCTNQGSDRLGKKSKPKISSMPKSWAQNPTGYSLKIRVGFRV